MQIKCLDVQIARMIKLIASRPRQELLGAKSELANLQRTREALLTTGCAENHSGDPEDSRDGNHYDGPAIKKQRDEPHAEECASSARAAGSKFRRAANQMSASGAPAERHPGPSRRQESVKRPGRKHGPDLASDRQAVAPSDASLAAQLPSGATGRGAAAQDRRLTRSQSAQSQPDWAAGVEDDPFHYDWPHWARAAAGDPPPAPAGPSAGAGSDPAAAGKPDRLPSLP